MSSLGEQRADWDHWEMHPAGRARVRIPGKLLGITAGAGTQHKPRST